MARLQTLKPRVTISQGRQVNRIFAEEAWGSGRGGRPWRRKRERILVRDSYTCQVCGLVTTELEVDHIVNIAQGGSDDDTNLQSICIPCHKIKTAQESNQGKGS